MCLNRHFLIGRWDLHCLIGRFRKRPVACLQILSAFLSVLLLGCASTGVRVEFDGLTSLDDLPKEDRKLWNMSQYEGKYLEESGLIYSDSLLTDYLQEVGMRLVPKNLKTSIIPFRFQVIYDPELNAFALPNGSIFVHLGLLARLENESQLAQVLSHEISHVVRRHAVYRYAHVKNVTGITQILSVATTIILSQTQSPWAGFWHDLAQSTLYLTAMATITGYGRAEEKEADLMALDYMIAGNYDVREAPKVFDHLLAEYDDPSAVATFFFADHPRLKSRVAYVRARVDSLSPTSSAIGSMPTQQDQEYKRRTELLRRKHVELWVRSGKYKSALKDADRVLNEHPDDPFARFWRGEAFRLVTENPDTLELAKTDYLAALQLDSTFAEPHRGLATLAEAQFDSLTAVREYKTYLDLSPQAKDRRYVISRIEALSKKGKRKKQ